MLTLALAGRWHGRYGSASCPAHEDRQPSLSLSDGRDGQLLVHCFAGCAFTAILDALRGRGLMPKEGTWKPGKEATQARTRRKEAESADVERRGRQARQVWDEAIPARGTAAEAYLRARGIALDALPESLRFHPHCWHGIAARRFPALVARVDGGEGFAVHRTFLLPDGSGKAAVEPAKTSLGAIRGGAVRLSAAQGPLVVAEGIETALAAGILLGRPARVWAALSAPGMAGMKLPTPAGELILAVDGDASGEAAGRTLGERAVKAGWQVSWWPAPPSRDWADMLLERGAMA
jgi:hypothetical protein